MWKRQNRCFPFVLHENCCQDCSFLNLWQGLERLMLPLHPYVFSKNLGYSVSLVVDIQNFLCFLLLTALIAKEITTPEWVIHERKEKRKRERGRSRQKCHSFYKQISAVKCHHFCLMLLKRWEMIMCQCSSCLYRIRFPSTAVVINKLIIDNI